MPQASAASASNVRPMQARHKKIASPDIAKASQPNMACFQEGMRAASSRLPILDLSQEAIRIFEPSRFEVPRRRCATTKAHHHRIRPMDMHQALYELGATACPLSVEERATFDRDGYLNLGQVLSPDQVTSILAALAALAGQEGAAAGQDGFAEAGTTSLGALENKGVTFEVLSLHPRLLAAVADAMGDDFGLSSLTSRAALPGNGHQAMHWDSSEARVVNAFWVLTAFTAENGATRVVPGSHRWGKRPEAVMADPRAAHPDEILLIAPAGTLWVFDARLWHSGTTNRSRTPRTVSSAFFMPRGRYQAGNVDRRLSRETQARLSAAALFVLDHQPPAEAQP